MIKKKEFGRTGHLSSELIFGAAAFYSTTDPDVVTKTMELVEEAGINHIDTAEDYGESQKMLGPWLKHNRKKVFLATKTKYRSYKEAKEDIQKSLDLLCVDSVDLWQMHCLAEPEEWDIAKDRENGVLRAFIEARDEGLVRYLGITSHGMKAAAMNLQCLNDFDFDTCLTPYNYAIMQDEKYRNDFEILYSRCKEKGVALQMIKTNCKGAWKKEPDTQYNTWYEPYTRQSEIDTMINWAKNRDWGFINSSADVGLLPMIINAASNNSCRVSDEEMAAFAAKTGMSNLFT